MKLKTIKVYTDASFRKDKYSICGFRKVGHFIGGTKTEVFVVGGLSNSVEAEQVSIDLALQFFCDYGISDREVIIRTDQKSLAEYFNDKYSKFFIHEKPKLFQELYKKIATLEKKKNSIIFEYVKSHVNLDKNKHNHIHNLLDKQLRKVSEQLTLNGINLIKVPVIIYNKK